MSGTSETGVITSAFSFAGHTFAQLPQPVQSSRLICRVKVSPAA